MADVAPQAVLLAAGRGTRMKSGRAKVLQPVLELPLLEHPLRAVVALGAEPVLVVVGHEADSVQQAFAGRGLVFLRQEPPRGTGHALQVAEGAFARHPERTLLVVNGDLPLLRPATLAALLSAHRRGAAAATLLSALPADPGAYGRVIRDGSGAVRAVVEARDASPREAAVREVNAGAYAFEVGPLLAVLGSLRSQNAQGEYYLTELVALLAAAGERVLALPAEDAREAMGVNTFAELAEASRLLRERKLAELMSDGVCIEDPATTHVSLDSVVEPGVLLRPYTFLEGRCVVRAGASVGPFARVVDCEIGPGAQILDHCLLRGSVVEAGAAVGPFSHARPDSVIGAGAKVGNFVELKKTRLGAGSKAPHLSYLGDATIGPKVNVGAGTITCNYDGAAKHPTRIEAGAFIGSDTTLVAPVTIGEGAYVGAGSTITQDVPAQALALGRARQIVKPDWARRRARPPGKDGA
jgi:bifunctional UDP-N-acetylglucosamine pyrophosphorylase/glucosamine-1-phosphate N-acetyltransferase